jgi:hypothetical protein
MDIQLNKKNTPSVFLPFLRQNTEGVDIFKVNYLIASEAI